MPMRIMGASSTGTTDWGAVATIVSAFLVAVATGFAALAARQSAKAAKRSAEFTRQAALLATIPRVVPWVSKGQIGSAINRGTSEAVNLRWYVIALEDGSVIHRADRQDVLPVMKTQELWNPDSDVAEAVREHRAGAGVEIVCEFWSTWGQQFTLRRELGMRRNKVPRLYDEKGQELKLGV